MENRLFYKKLKGEIMTPIQNRYCFIIIMKLWKKVNQLPSVNAQGRVKACAKCAAAQGSPESQGAPAEWEV